MSVRCTHPGLFASDRLWDVARTTEPDPELVEHLRGCRYCSELLESFQRLNAAFSMPGKTTLAVCPGASTLAAYHYGDVDADRVMNLERHLEACPLCREEMDWLKKTAAPKVTEMPRRLLAYALVAAAVLLIALIPVLRRTGPPSSRYADLAQMPDLDTTDLLRAARPADREPLQRAMAAYQSHDYRTAERTARDVLASADDPAAQFVLSMALYREGKPADAYDAMRVSERMAPMTAYRCWATLQLALLRGDCAQIERECSHVAGHPQYADRERKIQNIIRQRG
jgi:hypothetical protein